MTKLWLGAAMAAFGVALVVTASSCSGPKDLCEENQVRCDNGLLCDPTDGLCKCGGRGGVLCDEGFRCDVDSNTCLSTLCDDKVCQNQTSCDQLDGKCKCGGTGGVVCGGDEQCDPVAKLCKPPVDCRTTACPRNQSCDQTTGRCLCGSDACPAPRYCSIAATGAKACVDSLCSGVTCAGATACDPNDGACKCNGQVCASGEGCQCPAGADGGCADSARVCRPSSACVGVSCDGGTNCDPVDGQCKCGGPGGPACGPSQLCSLGPPLQCQGGNQCSLPDGGVKSCAGGTSCDPEDGLCKCGGRGGAVCKAATATEPAEVCISNPSSNACKRPCDPTAPDCPTGTYCYFDSSATTPAAYCSANGGTQVEGQQCSSAIACFTTNPAPRSLHCFDLKQGQFGLCRSYCNVATGSVTCSQVPRPQSCLPINGAPAHVGYCNPQ